MARFWSDHNLEPKRSYRFYINVGGIDKIYFTSGGRPSWKINSTPHQYLNHTFKFPGKVEFEDINVKIVEEVNNDSMRKLLNILADSGYTWTQNGRVINSNDLNTVSKRRAVDALAAGNGAGVKLTEINSEGVPICEYTLHNAWISNVKSSELSYSDEKLAELDLTITYDYAIINTDV